MALLIIIRDSLPRVFIGRIIGDRGDADAGLESRAAGRGETIDRVRVITKPLPGILEVIEMIEVTIDDATVLLQVGGGARRREQPTEGYGRQVTLGPVLGPPAPAEQQTSQALERLTISAVTDAHQGLGSSQRVDRCRVMAAPVQVDSGISEGARHEPTPSPGCCVRWRCRSVTHHARGRSGHGWREFPLRNVSQLDCGPVNGQCRGAILR